MIFAYGCYGIALVAFIATGFPTDRKESVVVGCVFLAIGGALHLWSRRGVK